jgi:hypothetical protein
MIHILYCVDACPDPALTNSAALHMLLFCYRECFLLDAPEGSTIVGNFELLTDSPVEPIRYACSVLRRTY